MAIHDLLDRLRRDYAALNPQVERIDALLAEAGEHVVHDHIALRTWGDPRCDIEVLARPFVRAGYRAAGAYRFAEKRLVARHFAHDDPDLPLVFVSELVLDQFSPGLQDMVRSLLAQVPEAEFAAPDLCARGRPWQIAHADVEALRRESEYAAWLAAFGWRANHFTVAVHALARLGDLATLDEFLKAHGLRLNTAGGEIKGSPAQGLEQSSTVADVVERRVQRRHLRGAGLLLRVRAPLARPRRPAVPRLHRGLGRQDLREHRPEVQLVTAARRPKAAPALR
ncbi:DUF1338 domain-containing protein [Nannocystis pusilla]|uniref:DUF1338 domain-containing protein n=1 Tax=Nannocystis pusilla TaxID=889268 RepID=UPI003DA325BB